jgi:hypothetical protein
VRADHSQKLMLNHDIARVLSTHQVGRFFSRFDIVIEGVHYGKVLIYHLPLNVCRCRLVGHDAMQQYVKQDGTQHGEWAVALGKFEAPLSHAL